MREYRFDNYRRVDKRIAKKLFEQGKDIVLCPVNLRPDGWWSVSVQVNKDDWGLSHIKEEEKFTKLVNEFEWYNCNNECGKYTAFYMKEENR